MEKSKCVVRKRTESVLAATVTTEKNVSRSYWEGKKMGQISNTNPDGRQIWIWVMKLLSESCQMSRKVCDRAERKKLKV